jgi:hypothetical protein
MVAIGALRDDGEQAATPTQPETTQPESTAPQSTQPDSSEGQAVPAQPEQGGGGGQRAGGGQAEPGTGTTPASPGSGPGTVRLKRRRFADRFTIGIPPAWDHGVEDRAVVITAPGATAELDVFFESGGRPASRLARAARGFLAQRHQRGQLSKSQPVRVGPRRGLRVSITYPGGEEVAVVVTAKGFSYLVLRRVDRGASADIGRQAEAALASFRPQ